MTDPRPVRLRLSRAKGYRLQDHSLAVNGLAAVNVARPSMFGNRWKVGGWSNTLGREIGTTEECVDLFRRLAWSEPHMSAWVRERLAGKNLACWCALDAPCHADVLLELAARQHEGRHHSPTGASGRVFCRGAEALSGTARASRSERSTA